MPSHIKQLAAYLLVGGSAVALYYLLVYLLYQRLHAHYLIAVSIAYAASVTLHFTANRNITFQAANAGTRTALMKYALLAGLNYLIALGVVAIAVQQLLLNVYVGSTLAILATMVIGFIGMKYWVFGGYKAIRA